MADKKVEQDIAVDQDKKKFVSDATRKILQLFNVQVTLSAPESAGIQWVQLKGRKEDIENAKNYINSLCSPEISDVKVSIPERYFEAILNYRDHVEKNSGAVVLFPSRTVASVQGSEMAVVIATSAIEERVNELKAGANGFPALLNSGSNSAQQKTEKEMAQNTPVPYIDPSLEEFAIKLGYTKDDIHQVLKKLGKEVDQNTLLRELIKVSSPSLLQRARPEYPLPKPVAYHDEVVARGASSRVAPKSYPYEDATSKKEDTIARGVMCRPSPRSFPQEPTSQSNRVIPKSFPFEGATTTRKEDIVARGACPRSEPVNTMQGVLLQHERQQYVYYRPEDDAFMYQQVVGNSSASIDTSSDLRHIVIDGSNVAMSHGNQQFFSCMGIKICVDYFKKRGHKDITVFVPQWRKETPRPDAPMKNREILAELEAERHLVYTPSRRVNGRRIVCYDDRFVLKLANDTDGVVVSNDHFRDLFNESPRWQDVIEQRILMYSFVNDIFMVPEDPLGRHGPTLDDFLRKGTPTHRRVCPYLKRCTYGLRCRFYHPERDPARKETVKPSNQRDVRSGAIQGVEQYQYHPGPPVLQQHTLIGQIRERAYDYPLQSANTEGYDPTEGARASTFQHLESVFPDQREIILQVMRENPNADVEHLGELITYHI